MFGRTVKKHANKVPNITADTGCRSVEVVWKQRGNRAVPAWQVTAKGVCSDRRGEVDC